MSVNHIDKIKTLVYQLKNLTMIKLLLLTVVTVFVGANSYGQQDPKAKQILDELSKTTKAYKTMMIKFTSTAVNPSANMEEVYEGQLWQKGDKYKLNFMDAVTFFNAENKWVYMPDVQEVNLFSVEEDGDSDNIFDNPQKIFTIYEDGFKYRYEDIITFNGEEVHAIELVPEDKNVEYFKIKIFISTKGNLIRGFKYFAKDGTRVEVKITELKSNITLSDSMFTFKSDDYPDAILIDMRE